MPQQEEHASASTSAASKPARRRGADDADEERACGRTRPGSNKRQRVISVVAADDGDAVAGAAGPPSPPGKMSVQEFDKLTSDVMRFMMAKHSANLPIKRADLRLKVAHVPDNVYPTSPPFLQFFNQRGQPRNVCNHVIAAADYRFRDIFGLSCKAMGKFNAEGKRANFHY